MNNYQSDDIQKYYHNLVGNYKSQHYISNQLHLYNSKLKLIELNNRKIEFHH